MDFLYAKALALLGEKKQPKKEVNLRLGQNLKLNKQEIRILLTELKKKNLITADKQFQFIVVNE